MHFLNKCSTELDKVALPYICKSLSAKLTQKNILIGPLRFGPNTKARSPIIQKTKGQKESQSMTSAFSCQVVGLQQNEPIVSCLVLNMHLGQP